MAKYTPRMIDEQRIFIRFNQVERGAGLLRSLEVFVLILEAVLASPDFLTNAIRIADSRGGS